MITSTIIGGLFVFAGLATIAATTGREWLRRRSAATGEQSASVSNTTAPAAFCSHVETIIAASEGAPAEMRLDYLVNGLSEADVLRQELARLRESQA